MPGAAAQTRPMQAAPPDRRHPSLDADGDSQNLSARLQSFFSFSAPLAEPARPPQPPASPAISLDDQLSLSMRIPCGPPSAPSPNLAHRSLHSPVRPAHSPPHSPHSPHAGSMNLNRPPPPATDPSPDAQNRKRASQPVLPILRWFSAKQSGKPASSAPGSPVRSRPPTPTTSRYDSPGPS